jgi:hypothetical protein
MFPVPTPRLGRATTATDPYDDSVTDASERSIDPGASYLLHLIENGRGYLKAAQSLLAPASPDLGLAVANLAAARRTLQDVDFYLSNVGLERQAKQRVLATRKRLVDQQRKTSQLCDRVSGRRTQRASATRALWQRLGWFGPKPKPAIAYPS